MSIRRNPSFILLAITSIVFTITSCDSGSSPQETEQPNNQPSTLVSTLAPNADSPQINIVYPDDHIEGPFPVIRYALTEPTGMDVYPLGDGSIALYGLFDTGSTKVRISNAEDNKLTYTNWGKSDVDHLKLNQVETVNLRLNGLQEEDIDGNVPISPPGSETIPQVDISDIAVKPENVDVTLIGAPLVNKVVTHINFTNNIIGLFSEIETVEINLYNPNDPNIPSVEFVLRLEEFGNLVSTDGATPGYRYWLRNVTFQNGSNTVSDQNDTLNFFFDTGTNLTIINNLIAEKLGLVPNSGRFNCFHGQNNGYFIDSVTMVGTEGSYKINNISLCWKEDVIEQGDAVIGTNFFDDIQIIVDGPSKTLGIKR